MGRRKKEVFEEEETLEIPEAEETEGKIVSLVMKATGKFEAVNGIVYSPEGKPVSKKMDVIKAEDAAKKFNYKAKLI